MDKRRTYKKIDLEGIDLPGPRQETIVIPTASKWKYVVGFFVMFVVVSAVLLLNWNAVSQAAFVRVLVGP